MICRASPAPSVADAVRSSSRPGSERRASTSARSAPTSSESSGVRLGPSPNQNGMVGAMPRASTTRTRLPSMRMMRHDMLPSRNTEPAGASMAKSSSSVPTRTPSGSATTS